MIYPSYNVSYYRRPSVAYVGALRSRVQFLEGLLEQVKNGTDEEIAIFVRKLRGGHPGLKLGQSVLNESSNKTDHATFNKTAESTALDSLGVEDGYEKASHDDGPSTLSDKLSQVMSQLDIDDGGEVHYFGPSSNLNLVSDIPRIAPPTREPDHSDSPSSSLDVYSNADQSLMLDRFSPGQAADMFDMGDYYVHGQVPNINPETIGPFAQPSSSTQGLEDHLLMLYWTWQHPFFLLFSKRLFLRDMEAVRTSGGAIGARKKHYSPLLLNAILAHAAHLSSRPDVRSDPSRPEMAGDRYFAKARKLLDFECESPSMTTVQALALMGSREAGCGRDTGLGWLYSGRF